MPEAINDTAVDAAEKEDAVTQDAVTEDVAEIESTVTGNVIVRAREGIRRRPRWVLGMVIVLVTATAGSAWWLQRGLPDDVAVRVGDEDTSVAELRDRMATLEALYGVTAPDGAQEEEFWRDAAHSVAVAAVLSRAAADTDVSISGNQVDQSLQQVIATFFGNGREGERAFSEALATAGTSEAAVRDELRRQLEINALFATVTGGVERPHDAELVEAYEDRRCQLRLSERRRLRNIVVATEADAKEALRRLRGGEPFPRVVAAMSIDESTRDTGGDLGLVTEADLEAAYADDAFGSRTGEVFGPVRGEFGWNVGRVDAVRPGRVPALAEIKEVLRQKLFAERQSEVWRDWLVDRLEAAEIEYGDDYAPKDPMALPARSSTNDLAPTQPVDDADC